MGKKRRLPITCLTLLLAAATVGAIEDLALPSPEKRSNPLAEEAYARIRAEFDKLRLDEKDFKVPAGWPLAFTVAPVEKFFDAPLEVPKTASVWADSLEESSKLAPLLTVARSILLEQTVSTTVISTPSLKVLEDLPPSLQTPLKTLAGALAQAQPLLSRAVDSISPEVRRNFLSLNEWPDPDTGVIRQEISARRIKRYYEGMKPFSERELLEAGQLVLEGVDRALASLAKGPAIKLPKPIRIKTPQGVFLLSGPGNDVYDQDDLKDVTVLIDLGGTNTYKVPVAVAHEKQIRVVIDLGANVAVTGVNDIRGNAGAGIFGIGVLALPNPQGFKNIQTGPFSQGVGVAGVGVLWVNGPANLNADRTVQGAGVFGVGIFKARGGERSTYVANRSGQGAAFTRGVGIFLHDGDGAIIKGGLVQPDPREPLGSVSMCQGVGIGPRAYAGGGVGIAIVKGNDISVTGSYFSQGVGYWHGLGIFRLRGDRCTLQARRYDMGSGVHSAFGHFDVYGNSNRILNWGVGPAYGWDHAAGSSLMEGDDNEVQTQWGAGTASIGSVSFSYYRGNRFKLKMCDLGSSSFFRNEPSYSVQIIDGTDSRMACMGEAETAGEMRHRYRSPWGLVRIKGIKLDEKLELQAPTWPEFQRQEAVDREMVNLQERIDQTEQKPAPERVADLVDVASAFSLDKISPRHALLRLLTLPDEEILLLIEALEPEAVDQLIQLAIAIPAHGDVLAQAILQALPSASLQKKSILINFLRTGRPATVLPALINLTKDPANEALKGALLRTMAFMLNRDTGQEPGARAVLSALEAQVSSPRNKGKREEALGLLEKLTFGESFGLLATASELSVDGREKYFATAPEELTGHLQRAGAKTFLTLMNGNRRKHWEILKEQRSALEEAEPVVRGWAAEVLTSTRPSVVQGAVVALGQIGHPSDAVLLEPLLEHANTGVREAAAVALARMGEPGLPILSRVLEKGPLRSRAVVMAGLSEAVSVKAAPLLEKGLGDVDPMVRLTALTTLDHLPPALQKRRPKLVSYAVKALAEDEDPDVQLALTLLK